MFKKIIQSCFAHPLVRELNPDSPESILRHSQIIREKSVLRAIYSKWYAAIRRSLPSKVPGPVLELGSGGGFLKDMLPDLITSEIILHPGVNAMLDGKRLPFRKASLRGIVMVDVFHHIQNVSRFLSEASYCIKPGGVVVMIEPWTTPWSRLVYGYLHHEPFDPVSREWSFSSDGRMSGANAALPWIVFHRDRKTFEKQFPEWQIKEIELHTPFIYLLSGGVSFRSVIPENLVKLVQKIEDKLTPWMRFLAMFATITLQRGEGEGVGAQGSGIRDRVQ